MAEIEYLARALIERDGRILVCRDLEHGHAYLPGGHVEFGESAGEAALRELDEECGLSGEIRAPLLSWEMRFGQGGRRKHELCVVFHVERLGDEEWPENVRSREAHLAFEWIEPAMAEEVGVVPVECARWLVSRSNAGASSGVDWLSIDESG